MGHPCEELPRCLSLCWHQCDYCEITRAVKACRSKNQAPGKRAAVVIWSRNPENTFAQWHGYRHRRVDLVIVLDRIQRARWAVWVRWLRSIESEPGRTVRETDP